ARRYVYNDVLKLSDAEKLMDCSGIQVEHIISTQGSLRINVSDHKMLGFPDIDEFQVVTPESVLDSSGSIPTSSGSTSSNDLRAAILCTATTEIVRKRRSNLTGLARPGSNRPNSVDSACRRLAEPAEHSHNSINRRKKGVPNRSPLC
uniref:Uncharacterized protein n=1 Tax=Chenopodium quinoa TaxID=63459 RepID=A0A803N3Q9_CHEQI